MTAVTNRALKLGISERGNAEVTVQGDLMLIGGTAYPRTLDAQRNQLIKKIQKSGFAHVMEEAAYTWFNRFMAIRYMEVHGYFAHGFRVLSNPSGGTQPEILQQAQNVSIPGLDKKRVVELLSQGNQQEELYRTLILAQSKALGQAMPFLFDTIDTSTELLLPDGLLAPQSVARKLVSDIPEDDWQSTEILGWLYQFYVSDEKARVDALVKKGQAVQPEDIPAKTQLFTPNWIVQFMTQNSLGRLWMDVYPDSPLGTTLRAEKMPYYTPPAEQEPEVAAKLREITPSSLDPNTLTAIDPAAGSGHILLVLYDLFYEFYRESGYPPADIPRLIVSQNLYGLELDRRAAQIAGFAVLMRARRDDPTLLTKPPVVNVLSLVPSLGLDAEAIAETLLAPIRGGSTIAPDDGLFPELAIQPRLAEAAEGVKSEASKADVKALIELFEEADVYGSLIRVPDSLTSKLPGLRELVKANLCVADLDRQATARDLSHLVRQAEFLAARYTVCVANPPYLGGKAMVKELKDFAKDEYPDTKSDLFAMFLERGFDFAELHGFNSMVTMQSWMFLSSYREFRETIVNSKTICAMAHLGARGFRELTGEIVQTTCTTFRVSQVPKHRGVYFRVVEGDEEMKASQLRKGECRFASLAQVDLKQIPGWPIAYWLSPSVRHAYTNHKSLGTVIDTRVGMATGDNDRFVRLWFEVPFEGIGFVANRSDAKASRRRWFPYSNGGSARRWFGNLLHVVDWKDDGQVLQTNLHESGRIRAHNFNLDRIFVPGLTWSLINSNYFAVRVLPPGCLFSSGAPSLFTKQDHIFGLLGYLNSSVAKFLLDAANPTLNCNPGDCDRLPLPPSAAIESISHLSSQAVDIAKWQWNKQQVSWDFDLPALLRQGRSIRESVQAIIDQGKRHDAELFDIERKIDRVIVESLALTDAIEPSIAEPTVVVDDQFVVFESISFGIGCGMGRYSLDEPGLIYAHQGGVGFNPNRYQTFPADQDGILPVTEDDFFGEEDTANRLARWVKTVWPNSSLDENLDFIADALGRKANETALETIRRYLATDFYKDHLQTYKKRPIYWLFSSGKHRAFQALVYLHRYNESTLSTMRSDYVTPLFGKLSAQINSAQIATETGSAAERNKAVKHLKKLQDQLQELHAFDQRLHHYALQRISLDLDDGVKVNYGKFSDPTIGEILANVKDITGGKDD